MHENLCYKTYFSYLCGDLGNEQIFHNLNTFKVKWQS